MTGYNMYPMYTILYKTKLEYLRHFIQEHDWVTGYNMYPMPSEEDNCHLVEVSEAEVQNSVRSIPKLNTLILVKVNMIYFLH